MNRLDSLRAQAQKALTFISIGVAVAYALLDFFLAPNRVIPGTILLGLVAAVSFFSWRAAPNTVASRATTAAAVIAFPAVLVYMMSGATWQLDMHMVFFACLSATAIMIDWRAIVAASAVTAVHHLSLNFALPWAVFPDGSDFGRVVFHAVVVVGQAGALIWMTYQTAKALTDADESMNEASQAQNAADDAAAAQTNLQTETEERRAAIAKIAADFEQALRVVVTSVSDASSQVAQLAEQAAGATSDVTRNMDEVNEAASRASTAAEEFAGASSALSENASQLDTELDAFKAALDAA